MKNLNPVTLQTSEEIREKGWQAESRDADGHLISCHAPIEADDPGIAEWIVECTRNGETVTFWPADAAAPTPQNRLAATSDRRTDGQIHTEGHSEQPEKDHKNANHIGGSTKHPVSLNGSRPSVLCQSGGVDATPQDHTNVGGRPVTGESRPSETTNENIRCGGRPLSYGSAQINELENVNTLDSSLCEHRAPPQDQSMPCSIVRPEALAPCAEALGERVREVGTSERNKPVDSGLTTLLNDLSPAFVAEHTGVAGHEGLRTEARAHASPRRREVGDAAYITESSEKGTPASRTRQVSS